jgi:hypothetical protein
VACWLNQTQVMHVEESRLDGVETSLVFKRNRALVLSRRYCERRIGGETRSTCFVELDFVRRVLDGLSCFERRVWEHIVIHLEQGLLVVHKQIEKTNTVILGEFVKSNATLCKLGKFGQCFIEFVILA